MNRNRKQREKKRKKKRKKNRKREKRKRNEKKGRGKRKEKRGKCIRARISSVAARERSFGLAVGASNVSSEYCMGVPVYLVRGRALVQIVRSGWTGYLADGSCGARSYFGSGAGEKRPRRFSRQRPPSSHGPLVRTILGIPSFCLAYARSIDFSDSAMSSRQRRIVSSTGCSTSENLGYYTVRSILWKKASRQISFLSGTTSVIVLILAWFLPEIVSTILNFIGRTARSVNWTNELNHDEKLSII
mgnify:CR=1 FL=1